jgi:exopolysaccharide production protein ExoZ
MTKELIAVQYLRAIAVILVVLHHLSSAQYPFIPQLGGFGVDVFFVISGFIMWYTTAAIDISALEFWRRRIIRIVPLYWIFLSLLIAVALLAPNSLKTTVITPENTVKSFLFIPHFHAIQNIIAPILIPGWSLDYEMFFYLIFGLTLLVSSLSLRAILLGTALSGLVLLGHLLEPMDAVAATYTSPELLKFLGGIILAMAYQSNRLISTALGLFLITFGILSHAISVSTDFDEFNGFVGLSPALIVGGALALEPAIRRAPSALLHTIGNASYSIYLGHLFFLRLSELGWHHFAPSGSNEALDATYVIFSFIFATGGGVMIYYFIERSVLLFFKRRPALVELR